MDNVNADRGLEMLVGAFIFLASMLCVGGVAVILALAPLEWDVVLATAALLLLGLWLGRLAYRLFRGHGRRDGGLFSPGAILIGGAVLTFGAIGLIALGSITENWRMIVTGLAGLCFGFPAWRLYKSRVGSSET